jgi:hypothetical protein
MFTQLAQHPRLNQHEATMPDLQALRKRNLRALIKQWEGPSNLAKKLHYSGPSYLSQMIGPGKPITEKTARFIEATLSLPSGWMDADHAVQTGQHTRVDTTVINRVMCVVGAALQDAGVQLSPPRLADLVGLAYEHAVEHGEVDDDYIARLVKLIIKE